jgi:calcineurin-like phosphoesterase family protein
MPKDIWIISDLHLSHKNIIKFTREDGNLLRPGFRDIQHHDECLIENWNSVVKPGNKVYVVGDFGNPELANRLQGQKRLILGNHDDDTQKLMGKFKKIMAWRRFKEDDLSFVLTHFPLLIGKHDTRIHFNIHGHIHHKLIADQRYINVCVEHWNYTPVHLDELIKIMRQRKKHLDNLGIAE